jgi:hypothetical protein
MKQGSSLPPASFDRSVGASEHFRGFFDGKAAEVSELDDAAERFVEAREAFQRLVKGDDLFRAFDAGKGDLVRRHYFGAAATLGCRPPARVIHGELSHRLRRQRKEMLPVVDGELRVLRELQVRFVHQDRRLQRLVAALSEAMPGQRAKLVIDERHQPIDRSTIAAAPCGKQFSDGRVGRHSVCVHRILRPDHADC